MTTEDQRLDLSRRRITGARLRGTTFHDSDFADVVIRGSEAAGMEIDSPWLFEDGARRFEASPRRATPKSQPPSTAQHRPQQ